MSDGTLVVDASVAAKWVLHETGSEAALATMRGGRRLIAPALVLVKVANALRKRVAAGQQSRAAALTAYRDLLAAPLVRVAVEDALVESAMQIAFELRHPVQDCLYLALAAQERAVVITADGKFAAAARAHPRHARAIELLAS